MALEPVMRKRRIAALVITALFAVILWQEALYITNGPVTMAWDRGTPVENGPESYVVVAVWEGVSGAKQEFPLGETAELQMVIQRPRTGFFHFKVKAKNSTAESAWAISTDPNAAKVDNLPRGWRVFFEVSAPGGGGIV
jgi:hypothetical protein